MTKSSVFISGDMKDVKDERELVEWMIREVEPFKSLLDPIALGRTAGPRPAITESLRNARECKMYIGIIGKDYSETTHKEFKEARKANNRCLVFVRVEKTRDPKVKKFIEDVAKKEIIYKEFSDTPSLVKAVENSLQNELLRTLDFGLKVRGRPKKQHRRRQRGRSEA